MTQVLNKPSLDETLEHFGVLGMHWGSTRVKASGSQVRSARRRLTKQTDQIMSQEDVNSRMAKGSAARIAGDKKVAAMDVAFLKNPDRVTAVRLTRGEKAVALLFVPLGLGVGAIVGTSARSRQIEYKQKTGAYNK